MTANSPQTRKAKGRILQQRVRDDIIARFGFSSFDVISNPMGCSGCDVKISKLVRNVFPFAIECKNQDRVSLLKWWEQCENNAALEMLCPALVIGRSRKKPLVVLDWETFLALFNVNT